ncbi:MAG TPA: hypothetical protein VHZ53_01245 [Steroidobacteraceae bacterium]|jgi:hypothetical protein|nr:hypothetical protein [Steroidobacteraceae bacterium]
MKVAYSVPVTDEYLKDVQRLVLAQNTGLRLIYQTWWFMWPPRIVSAGFIVWMCLSDAPSFSIVALFGAVLIFTFIQPMLSRRALAKARNRNPIKGSTVTFSIDEQGVNTIGPNSNSLMQWSGLPSAIFYPQGVLLKVHARGVMWLPDESLVEGIPADARALVRQNVKAYTESA